MCALKLDLDKPVALWFATHMRAGLTWLSAACQIWLYRINIALEWWTMASEMTKKLFANTLHTISTYWLTRAVTVPWVWTWLSSSLILLTAGCASVGVGAVKSEKAVLTGYIRNFSWHKTYERWRQLDATWIAPWGMYRHSQLHSQSYMQNLHL